MFDERFVMHRYKSTSHAAVVGAVTLGGFFFHQLWTRDLVRWDLAIPLIAMAVVKLAAMTYYHFTD